MDIRISGHRVETGEALREHVTDKLTAVASRYFDRAVSSQVTFGKGPHDHSFTCDVVLRVPQGVVLKGSGQAASAQSPLPPSSAQSSSARCGTIGAMSCASVRAALRLASGPASDLASRLVKA